MGSDRQEVELATGNRYDADITIGIKPRVIQIGGEQHLDRRFQCCARTSHPAERDNLGDAGQVLEGVDTESNG